MMARKKGTSSGDYEGWLLRSIENPEELFFARQSTEWLKFIGSKSFDYNGAVVSKAQQAAINEMRDMVSNIGSDFTKPMRSEVVPIYRDRRGHFAKASNPEARLVGQVQRFSEMRTGRRTSLNAFTEQLSSYKATRLAQIKDEMKRERKGE